MYVVLSYVRVARLVFAMILHYTPCFTMYVFYEMFFVRNDEINKLLLLRKLHSEMFSKCRPLCLYLNEITLDSPAIHICIG